MDRLHVYLVRAAFGWMALSGVLHFMADVASQYIRRTRVPSPETTLYYGLHSAYAWGHIAFGALALYLVTCTAPVMNERGLLIMGLVVALGWLAIAMGFIEYWQPKANAVVLCALMVAALLTRY
ncbi:MAG TPA: hypothetical protein VGE27_12425 [Gemmatimonas sp.]|uniref:hypothetical protein n=1 Tax=Gemmatimonas sp. TaxID=1962908 RepID=UPI002ED77532